MALFFCVLAISASISLIYMIPELAEFSHLNGESTLSAVVAMMGNYLFSAWFLKDPTSEMD